MYLLLIQTKINIQQKIDQPYYLRKYKIKKKIELIKTKIKNRKTNILLVNKK